MTYQSTRNVEPLFPYRNKKYSIIIVAAGSNHRIATEEPRSLLKISNSQTLIERQITIIDKIFPNKEIIVVGGYHADALFNKLPRHIIKVENERYDETSVVRSIGIGLRACSSNLALIIYGDVFFNKRMISLPFRKHSCILSSQAMPAKEIGFNHQNNYLVSMFYDLPDKWAQIGFFKDAEFEMLRQISLDKQNEKMFTYQCINQIVDMGGVFKVEKPRNGISMDIDTSYDLHFVRKNYANSM